MKLTTKVAFVSLARATFDLTYAREIRLRSLALLNSLDGVQVLTPEDVVIEPERVGDLANALAAERPDILILQNATFALGNLAVTLAQTIPAPILLWAVTEPEMSGGTLRSNSLVGMHLNASNLFKLGYRPRYIYGLPEELTIQEKLQQAVRVAGAMAQLKRTKIGLIGGRAEGFYNVGMNELHLRQHFGVEVQPIGLNDAFAAAYGLSEDDTHQALEELEGLYPKRNEIQPDALEKMARQFGGLRFLAEREHLNALSVRCWPEWAAQYGVAACGSVSALNSIGLTTGCEGDVDGTVTMLLGRMISCQPTFMTDFITAEPQDGTGYFWHGGCAAVQLARAAEETALNTHFAGGKGITAGFTFNSGRITIVRLSHDGQCYRLFLTGGEALPTQQVVKGVLMKVKFDAPVEKLLDTAIYSGLEHHFCVMYGDWRSAWETFAAWNDLEILTV